jgi:hypothetical protein
MTGILTKLFNPKSVEVLKEEIELLKLEIEKAKLEKQLKEVKG